MPIAYQPIFHVFSHVLHKKRNKENKKYKMMQVSFLSLLAFWICAERTYAFSPLANVRSLRQTTSIATPWVESTRSAPTKSRHVLFMGWGPDPIWSGATVKSKTDACNSGRSVLLEVDVPAETAAEYKIPGMFRQALAVVGVSLSQRHCLID